jgi:F0F1-type ATP synthase assembly protein I
MREKKQNEVADMLVLIVQIGITMIVPIIMCTVGGAWLDGRIGTKYIGVIGFVLGAIAGFQNVYRLVKKYLKDSKSPGEIQRELDEKTDK